MFGSESVDLTEVAQDLARYYADESYVPAKLVAVLAAGDINQCTLTGSPQTALLKCGKSAEDLAKPYIVKLDLAKEFTSSMPLASAILLKINNQPTGATFTAGSDIVSVLISYKGNKKPTCYTVPATVPCMFAEASKVEVKTISPSATGANIQVNEDAYITIGVFDATQKPQIIAGVKKSGASTKTDFVLVKDASATGGYSMSPGSETQFTNIEQLVFKQILTLTFKKKKN